MFGVPFVAMDLVRYFTQRALEGLHLVMQHVAARPDVDNRRVLLSGISRGGILASAYAGQHPQAAVGVINFVGGQNGHYIAGRPDLWRTDVDAYLRDTLGP